MEGMIELICLQRTSYRAISIDGSPNHSTYTLSLLQLQEIDSTCVFCVVTIDIDYADDDRNCHCDV
jgi:flagellar assembly factor FliW